MDLAATNRNYRRPDLYDKVRADNHATVKLCEELIDLHGIASARTLLDLGCGTARDLEHLAARYTCTGVDLQPQMIAYARQVRPGLDLRVGDLRTFRLGYPVDVVTCLGNALAYIHDNAGLRAAFATFAAHAHAGTLLILQLPVAPSLPAVSGAPPRTTRADALDAEVTLSYIWDLRAQVETMYRTYRFDDGHTEQDTIARRVLGPCELDAYLTWSGFQLRELFDTPDHRDTPTLTGPSAYAVAAWSAPGQPLAAV